MRYSILSGKLVLTLAGALIFSGVAMAANMPCMQAKATPESYTWNFSKEGTQLINEVEHNAREVRAEAATLQSLLNSPSMDWQAHAAELTTAREQINRMGRDLCRLQTIRGQLNANQQAMVDKMAPRIKELAMFTEDAINFLNSHENTLWQPTYRTYDKDMYLEARAIVNTAEQRAES